MTATQNPPAIDELDDGVRAELDAAIAELTEGASRWAATPLVARAALFEETAGTATANAEAWATAAIAAKGTPPALAGEEWMSGPYATTGGFQTAARTLRALAAGQSPAADLKTHAAPGGRTAMRVLPYDFKETLLLHGFTAEVWSEPGISAAKFKADAGLAAKTPTENGGVGLVLGAGNISAIGPLDVLYELVAFNRVALLKLNPTFASLKPVYEAALAPLIRAGVLRIVNGAAAVGGYLTAHPGVNHVHITGSAVTHDAIVWGRGEEADQRRAAGTPLLTKEITSELGGVAPVIIVPGEWSKADLRFQAEHVATMRLHNGGHNCIAAQTIVLSADWPQRDAFLAEVRDVLDNSPKRDSWYPGTERKVATAESCYPSAEHHGNRLLIEVTPQSSQDLFTDEYFGPVLGYTALPGTGIEFLRAAVAFSNDRLYGTLGANLLIEPRQRKAMGAAFDEAIADLRYGTIAINSWTALGFLAAGAPWGAFPGHTLEDVGSGIGIVHNGFLLDHVERTIVSGPFRPSPRSLIHGEMAISPKPPWFVTARTQTQTGAKIAKWAVKRSWLGLLSIVSSAIRA